MLNNSQLVFRLRISDAHYENYLVWDINIGAEIREFQNVSNVGYCNEFLVMNENQFCLMKSDYPDPVSRYLCLYDTRVNRAVSNLGSFGRGDFIESMMKVSEYEIIMKAGDFKHLDWADIRKEGILES